VPLAKDMLQAATNCTRLGARALISKTAKVGFGLWVVGGGGREWKRGGEGQPRGGLQKIVDTPMPLPESNLTFQLL
jgi:hypothetical protein